MTQVCQKLLSLETLARQAEYGTFLDVTSGDGEWFLADEIHMQVCRSHELIVSLPVVSYTTRSSFQIGLMAQILHTMDILGLYPQDSLSGKSLHKLHAVIKQLQTFNTSFFGIVLPEGLKSFQSEDPAGLSSRHKLTVLL